MMRIPALALLAATGLVVASNALEIAPAKAPAVRPSAKQEAQDAANRAVDWLLKKQSPDGSWSNPEFPALTALPLWALVSAGSTDTQAIDRAVAFILKNVHEDGSIFAEPKQKRKGGGLKNYNTALCMVALHATGRADLVPVVQKARSFVAGSQHLGGDVYFGGMGYDAENNQAYADLSNSYIAYEAMRLTENVEDLRKSGDKHADLDWKAAEQFIRRVQNLPGSNDQPWANEDPEHKGGFAYNQSESKAGSYTNAEGKVRFRSYASMTYAGILSFIYADVSKTDDRVKSAFDWAAKHWSLDENPGMGQQGYYYFLNVLAKGLAAYGEETITTAGGEKIGWREALINKLVSVQKRDDKGGYWVNAADRWWEADPVLVTSYSIIALEIAAGAR